MKRPFAVLWRRFTSGATLYPGRLLAAIVAVHVVLWWAAQALTQHNLPLDMIQLLAWGQGWQIAYYAHPPLAAWLLEGLYELTGRLQEVLYLTGPLFVVATMWAVWRLGRRVAAAPVALAGALALTGSVYYGFTSPEFNHNVVQYPFWALLPLALYGALSERKLRDWALAGLWAAGALYAKYSGVLLIATAGLFILLHPAGRAALRTKGPYVALAVAAVLLAPHVAALSSTGFEAVTTPVWRASSVAAEPLDRLMLPLKFLGAQLIAVLGTLLLVAVLVLRRRRSLEDPGVPPARFDRAFLLSFAFGPLVLALAVSAAAGIELRSMWGATFFPLLGLALLVAGRPTPSVRRLRRFLALWIVLFVAGLGGYLGKTLGEAWLRDKGARANFPGRALAGAVEAAWRARVPNRRLAYVVGDKWIAGNVSAYAPSRPFALIDGDPAKSPWVDPARLDAYGAVVVWQVPKQAPASYVPPWAKSWRARMCRTGETSLAWQSWVELPPAKFRYGFVGAPCKRRSR